MALTSRSASARARRATLDLFEALGSSLDIRQVLETAYPLLLRLVPADYGALGISPTGRPQDYEWIVARIPPAFFAAYPQMAAHDFVRTSVAEQPNRVLRDQEMVSRSELEANMMYRHARELGVPLEQVMAVMLHVDDRWQSGLSLYRERRRPFTYRERAILQDLTPAIVNAVRSCQLFGGLAARASALEALLSAGGGAYLIATPSATIVEQSAAVTPLIERWFGPDERTASRLPDPLAAVLSRAAAAAADSPLAVPANWIRRGAEATLEASFLPCARRTGGVAWLLMLRETHHATQLPAAWRARLTPRQRQVTAAVLRGWDNQLIAADLGCAVATVKKHLQMIFDSLGVPSRAVLIASATASQRRD